MPKKKTRRQKWLDALCAHAGGREPTCPNCGGHNFAEAYVELDAEENCFDVVPCQADNRDGARKNSFCSA